MRGFLVAFNLLMVAFAMWALHRSRQHEIEQASVTTLNLAKVLEASITGTIRQIDLALLSVKEQTERSPGGPHDDSLGAFAESRLARLGMVDALRITDREGRVLHGASPGGLNDLGRRDFFLALKKDPQAGLVVSRPARDARDGAWALTLAHRIEGADGAFAGAVCATLTLEQLGRAMSLVDVGRNGSISLRGRDLDLLVRYPAFAGQEQLIGDTRVFGDYLSAVKASVATSQFSATSVVDGQRRLYTLRKLEAPRLYVLVGLAEADYLRAWRHQATFAAVAVAGLVGLTLAMGWLARATWLRQLADQERLAAQEAKYRLLAENALDVIWSMDSDGRLTYISPSLLRQRGWTPEEFMSLGPEGRALSSDGAALVQERMAHARQLPPGSQPFEQDLLRVTVKRKDGQEIQVETRWRIVWGEDDSLLGFQGVTRDITERMRLEADRENLIRDLTQALTEVKQLSGMLPICSQCKKVRDDQGYWSQIETYLSQHTEATFTHGVCPECAAAFRQEMQARREQRDPDERQG
jgi:PAS domain S-box-containing protein